jgi:hypothetical protein
LAGNFGNASRKVEVLDIPLSLPRSKVSHLVIVAIICQGEFGSNYLRAGELA